MNHSLTSVIPLKLAKVTRQIFVRESDDYGVAISISKLGNARIFKRKLETLFANKEKIVAEKLDLPFLEYFMLKFFL